MKTISAILFTLVAAMLITALFQIPLYITAPGLVVAGLVISHSTGYAFMAISATIIDIRGKAYEPIIEELLFENDTVKEKLVAFETDVKANTIFTENINTVTMQAYTCGAPTPAGSIGLIDTAVTPVKVMYYDEFCPDNLRFSRFNRSMKPGAWNTTSSEFERVVLGTYANQISSDAELKFWSGITAAKKTAIAALTPGTANTAVGAAEQALAAALPTTLIDGVVANMIYNNSAVGKRIKVVGTTITSSNIAGEYAKIYAAMPAENFSKSAGGGEPYLYVPHSHKQMINIYNITATYRDLFSVSADKKSYYYNGVELKFVPIPENVMIAALPDHIIWATDLLSDLNYLEVNKIANNRDDMFLKNVFTLASHVVNQRFNTLYVG